jgi:hypothetical protein
LFTAIILSLLDVKVYFLWGMIPYAVYLELLNFLPFEYASGKTDMMVYVGLRSGADVETVMVSAMEIQGQLYEGKTREF